MKVKKLICTVMTAVLVCSSISAVRAANDLTNNAISLETAKIEGMCNVTEELSFDFETVTFDSNGVIARFVSSSRVNNYPYLCEMGTKIEAEKLNIAEYVLGYNKQYSFVYSCTENTSQIVYNATVLVENNNGDIDIVIKDVVKNTIPHTASRASGTKNEIESNNTYGLADRTYDDYDNYGTINPQTDVDWWVVKFTSSGNANFWLGNIPGNCDLDIELYASDGTTRLDLSTNGQNNAELITYPVEANVNYYVRIYSFTGSSTSQYLFRTKNYPSTPAPTIPSNSIGVHVTDTSGNPIENAVVYVYKQRYTSAMYPQYPAITNEAGYAIISNLTSSGPYGVNVIANNYESKSISSFVPVSSSYYEVVLNGRNSTQLNDPIAGFSPISYWAHGGGESYIGCTSECSLYTRICPHEYMNVYIPQNFGWRYRDDSRLEFHQAIDVSASLNTPQYNVFKSAAYVTKSNTYSGCGKTVQLYSNTQGLYATYMHLNSYPVSAGTTVADNAVIGYTGNTGTVGYHMHFSLATSDILYVTRDAASDPIIIDWEADEVEVFVDPLAYIN